MENIYEGKSWPIGLVERKIWLKIGKNGQKMTSKWLKIFSKDFQISFIKRAYISREKCDLVH